MNQQSCGEQPDTAQQGRSRCRRSTHHLQVAIARWCPNVLEQLRHQGATLGLLRRVETAVERENTNTSLPFQWEGIEAPADQLLPTPTIADLYRLRATLRGSDYQLDPWGERHTVRRHAVEHRRRPQTARARSSLGSGRPRGPTSTSKSSDEKPRRSSDDEPPGKQHAGSEPQPQPHGVAAGAQ
jgi:hypothetical protein